MRHSQENSTPHITVAQENSAISPDIAGKHAVMGINQIGSIRLYQIGNIAFHVCVW
jgi:hypothetical protein